MKILITGGSGLVGSAVTERLIRRGMDVRVIGLEPAHVIVGGEYVHCDIMDYDHLHEQMRGCDAVIHLAALSSPTTAPGNEVFRINCAGTYNVFEAAAVEGIRRIVQASSINAIGCAWSITDIAPRYFPIDEEHPSFTTDPYSFSKQMVEEIGDYYWRREGISSVSLRLPWVYSAEHVLADDYQLKLENIRSRLDALRALPPVERQTKLADARRYALAVRADRQMEYPRAGNAAAFRPSDLLNDIYHFGRFNFWAYIDKRNSALAFENALTADYDGSHPLFVNDLHNWINYDSRTLVRLFFPEVSRWKKEVNGVESLITADRAKALIGYEPEYSLYPSISTRES